MNKIRNFLNKYDSNLYGQFFLILYFLTLFWNEALCSQYTKKTYMAYIITIFFILNISFWMCAYLLIKN